MSGQRLSRKQRLAGKIGAAAVIATLAGVPQDLGHWLVGSHKGGSVAYAAPKPKPPKLHGAVPIQALNQQHGIHWFAAWDETGVPSSPDFFPTPFNTQGVPAIQDIFNSTNASRPRGLKVVSPLTNDEAFELFAPTWHGRRPISYVFSDMEQGDATEQTNNVRFLVNQIRSSGASRNAYVGHFGLTPLSFVGTGFGGDPTRRGPVPFTKSHYDSANVNMANTVLYPGHGDYRSPSTGDWNNSNIRTGLFIGPIGRMSAVQDVLNEDYKGDRKTVDNPDHHKQIPWVARFNNYGNQSLDTDGNPLNGFRFVPGQPLASNPSLNTANQMLSRGDFQAQILHYRLRGAYSVNLFHEGGASAQVEGYSSDQAKEDIRKGWYDHDWNNRTVRILDGNDSKPATLSLNPIVDGTSSATGLRSEETGVIWSGQYDGKKLDILASNLDTVDHLLQFPRIADEEVYVYQSDRGWTYEDDGLSLSRSKNYLLEDGIHKILQFDEVKTRVYETLADLEARNKNFHNRTIWLLSDEYTVFADADRNGVGIPEPTTFGMLAAAGSMAVVCRRQRRNAQA